MGSQHSKAFFSCTIALALAVLFLGFKSARAQDDPTGRSEAAQRPSGTNGRLPSILLVQLTEGSPSTRESASRLDELSTATMPVGSEQPPLLGPTPPQDVKLFMDHTALGRFLESHGTRVYGWLDMGYTPSSSGSGLMNVEPRENRFGNEFLVNQMAVDLEHPLKTDELSFGYNALFYAGADAALLRPRGGFTTTNPRFGADFRELYASAHLPILSDGGVDLKLGRQTSIIGYASAMAPYRPFYSNDYQWFYSEDGAWTGVLANWHVNKQLDVLSGFTFGGNTFFTLRGNGPCYIGQINYYLQEAKTTLLSGSVHVGPEATFVHPSFDPGNNVTMIELRIQQSWSRRLTQIIQSDNGWETSIPGVGTGQWYSLYNIFVWHMTRKLDCNSRVEWFDDPQGTRTSVKANYAEVTLGCDYHPVPWLRLRPEIRGDFASNPAFGIGGPFHHSQLVAGIEALLQY